MTDVKLSLDISIAEGNVLMEMIGSGLDYCTRVLEDDSTDTETKKNIAEKAVIVGGLGMKVTGLLIPYMK